MDEFIVPKEWYICNCADQCGRKTCDIYYPHQWCMHYFFSCQYLNGKSVHDIETDKTVCDYKGHNWDEWRDITPEHNSVYYRYCPECRTKEKSEDGNTWEKIDYFP